MHWFKFYGGEYLSDPKMLSLNSGHRSCWLTLLSYASIAEKDGHVPHINERVLMLQAGIDPTTDEWARVAGVLKRFEELGMIEIDEEGFVKILNWNKRQETYLTNAERQRKYRLKQQENKNSNAEVTPVLQQSNARIRIELELDKNTSASKKSLEGFGEFWEAYPRKRNKVGASAEWRKLSKEDRGLALADVPKRVQSSDWVKESGAYIPMPQNYLKDRRWEDEVKPIKKIERFV